jgi:hypothetical protein
MDDSHKETLAERLREAMGLPPGDPEVKPERPLDDGSPRETLTSDDAEGLPPHNDVGPGLRKI